MRFDRRRQELGDGGARRRDDGRSTARQLRASEGEERGGTLVDEGVDAKV